MSSTPDELAAGIADDDAATPQSLTGLIRQFLRVKARNEAAKAEFAATKKVLAAQSQRIIEQMLEEGVDSPPAVDGMSVWIKPTYYVEYRINPDTGDPYQPADLADALTRAGMGHLVKTVAVNGNSLRAELKEMVENEQPVPETLVPYLSLGERFDVQAAPLGGAKARRSPRRTTP